MKPEDRNTVFFIFLWVLCHINTGDENDCFAMVEESQYHISFSKKIFSMDKYYSYL